MNDSDIDQLANWAEPILRSLAPAERKKLMRQVATKVRRSNVERMKRQENPDGSKWKPRRTASGKGGRKVHKSVDFLYDKGMGVERRRLQSWKSTPAMMTGYDPDAGGLRSFRKDRVVRYININTTSTNKRLRERGKIRKKAMFNKLRTTKYLKIGASPDAATLTIPGRVGGIARVHQFGLRSKVSEKGPMHDYPQRELLGISRRDLEMISDEILNHVSL